MSVDLGLAIKATVVDVAEQARTTLGYPCARTHELIDWSQLDELHRWVINQVGDPWLRDDVGFAPHVRGHERAVLDRAARWFALPADYWGCVLGGSSEAIGQGLRVGRAVLPGATLYHSQAAHVAVPTWAEVLGLPSVVVAATSGGAMDLDDLAARVTPGRPAIVAATAGTTMTEAIDDVPGIHDVLDEAGAPRYVHLDAALSGITLGTSAQRHHRDRVRVSGGADRAADSGNLSLHKFIGTPAPGALFLAGGGVVEQLRRSAPYVSSRLATMSCSRSGHVVLQAWLALATFSDSNWRSVALACRRRARWLHGRLRRGGIEAFRHPHGLTVWFPRPPDELITRYGLAADDQIAHVVCVPGVDDGVLDAFVADMTRPADLS